MKLKKILSGVLSSALLVTSILGGTSLAVQADETEPQPIATYDFENGVGDDTDVIVTGLGTYSGDVTYDDGRGSEKAVQLGEYGLKLNQNNLGDNYTVSMWVNPSSTSGWGTGVMFLGYDSPEKWVAVAGTGGAGTYQLWSKADGTYNTLSSAVNLPLGQWTMITLSQSGDTLSAYVNGDHLVTGNAPQALNGADQDIYIGVNAWDAEFVGLVDDVSIYDSALTAAQITELYNTPTAEETFNQDGFVVDDNISVTEGSTSTLTVTVPSGVTNATYEFTSDDPLVAEVSSDGIVTGVAVGTTVITTKVTYLNIEKEATTNVTVQANSALQPLATYDFENGVGDDTDVIVTGLSAYTGAVSYGTGRTGSGQSVQLGDYGLKLNQNNIGENYTISMWVNPSSTSGWGTGVMFLGYDSPEKWVAVAGTGGAGTYQLWSKADGTYNTLSSAVNLPLGQWTMVTLSQSGDTLSAYINGELLVTGSAPQALNGADQDIYIGVNAWDAEFVGLVDDVSVYDSVLTAAQVRELYDGKTAAEVFKEEGFSVPSGLSVYENATKTIEVTVPDVVSGEIVEFSSSDTSIATIDSTGAVTGVSAGVATITTTVTFEGVVKTAETVVTVKTNAEVDNTVAVEYDMDNMDNATLTDVSGHGNDATIKGSDADIVVEEDDTKALQIDDQGTYVELPLSIMDDLTDKEKFTIEVTYARSSSSGTNAWLYCFGSNPKSSGTNYMFYCPFFETSYIRSGIKNGSSEQLFTTSVKNNDDQYYTVAMTFEDGKIRLYVDGVKVDGELDSGYSIVDDVITDGCKNDILGYIGKSCWSPDGYFEGKISSFKIYDKAMTEDDIKDKYQEKFEETVAQQFANTSLLGKNTDNDAVYYNVSLPTSLNGLNITWASSNPDVISSTGTVTNPTEATTVILTATVTSGNLSTELSFTFTVQPIDRSELDTVLAEANEYLNASYYTDASLQTLATAVAKAEAITSQSEVSSVISSINTAIRKLTYKDEYVDPISIIDNGSKPATTKSMKVNDTAVLFTLPDSVKDFVDVAYSSSNSSVAKYDGGKATALKAGTATLTVTVTAKYDGFPMNYTTQVTVTAADTKTTDTTVTDTKTTDTKVDLSKVTIKAAKKKLAKGKTTKITVTLPATVKASGATVTYKATGAVKVNKNGKVTGKKAGAGTVTVTVKAGTEIKTKKIKFKVAAISGKSSVKVGKTITLKVKGINKVVKWKVSNKKVATIKKTGKKKAKLTAKKKGKVVVTATVAGVKIKKTIKVKK